MPDSPSAAVARASAKPRPSSLIRSTVRPMNESSTSTWAPRVLGDVRQALLGHPVDHQLLLGGELRHRARERGSARDAGLVGEVPHLAVERGEQAVVVEHRWAQLAGERQQLVHRLAREPLGLGQLATQLGRGVLDRRLEPQGDRGQGLVDLVVEVLRDPPALALLGLDRRRGRPRRRSASSRAIIRSKAA